MFILACISEWKILQKKSFESIKIIADFRLYFFLASSFMGLQLKAEQSQYRKYITLRTLGMPIRHEKKSPLER